MEVTYEDVKSDGLPAETKPLPKRDPRIKLPEAGGVAWADLTVFIKEGDKVYRGKINLTARAFTASEAIDNLMEGIKHASEAYNTRFLHR